MAEDHLAPTMRQRRVAQTLAEHGHELRYHGDLDGEGVRIAAYVMAKTGARPWRMSQADYSAAVPSTGPPVGRVSAAPWDAELAETMMTHGVAVVEERTSGLLLADLAIVVGAS